MTKKMNSQAMMDMIDDTLDTVQEIKDDMNEIKEQMETKLAILNTYYDTANKTLAAITANIKEAKRQEDTVVFGLDYNTSKIVDGSYSIYGQTIHPAFVKLPEQIFNFVTGTSQALFKDNVDVSFIVGDTEDFQYEYCNILKDESDTSKIDVFKSFDLSNDKQLTLAIEIHPANLVGNAKCNMIEINPYLPGTFDITGIRIYTLEQYLMQQTDDEPAYESTAIYKNVGAQRIMLDGTYQIYRFEMDIQVHMPSDMPDYFGLRHLYFYNADIDEENSYVVVKIQKDSYINSTEGNVTIYTAEDTKDIRPESYGAPDYPGIQYYMLYENDTLQGKVSGQLARNVRELYAKIPLFEPIKAVHFDNIQTR